MTERKILLLNALLLNDRKDVKFLKNVTNVEKHFYNGSIVQNTYHEPRKFLLQRIRMLIRVLIDEMIADKLMDPSITRHFHYYDTMELGRASLSSDSIESRGASRLG